MTPTLKLIFCIAIIYQQVKQPINNAGYLIAYRKGYVEDPS